MGTNSTGKTFLLKSVFYLFKVATLLNLEAENQQELQQKIFKDMMNIFGPRSKIDSLIYNESMESSLLKAELEDANVITTELFPSSSTFSNQIMKQIEKEEVSVFIPSKELMSFLPELISVARDHDLKVDLTYREMLNALSRPNLLAGAIARIYKIFIKGYKA